MSSRCRTGDPRVPAVTLLDADKGEGWWWSGSEGKVKLKQGPTSCALAAAAADASFPARGIAEFVARWGFFDPNPFLLRRDWPSLDSGRFDPYGRNLAETLYALNGRSPGVLEQIVEATRSIVGLPSHIETRESREASTSYRMSRGSNTPSTKWVSPAARCACWRS